MFLKNKVVLFEIILACNAFGCSEAKGNNCKCLENLVVSKSFPNRNYSEITKIGKTIIAETKKNASGHLH